ncbi:MAG: bifunctional glutamate N-acetyltransferase/amino-acid acetyltransferase ArgJ [Propionibacteriaceae bacterium]|nr:bifunctional glutamate N-acetyltransferase/amino-acid acetyltransferase ArgJ [Propionibacteriaceae bacterium]
MTVQLNQPITTPQGFRAAGVIAGLKKSGKKDLALVVNDGPRFDAAALFTSNRFPAAPVQVSRVAAADGRLRAVILNSGGANACTGAQGVSDAQAMAEQVAGLIGADVKDVAVCSTGLIGELLPMTMVAAGIELATAALSSDGGAEAAEAIMTTDTVSKQATVVSDHGWVVSGMAKGAGMLAPALATMLVVITTDAEVAPDQLQASLAKAARVSFDRADSDGCMSTNDSVIFLANGASEVAPDFDEFTQALEQVCVSLAQQLIGDAEGAEHAITVRVSGAHSEDDAQEVARSIARSNLFKCAIAGNDPNWGRVLASMGTTAARFDPDQVDVSFNGVRLFHAGAPDRARRDVDLRPFEVLVDIGLNAGDCQGTIWTNDLTHGYVSENADYSS